LTAELGGRYLPAVMRTPRLPAVARVMLLVGTLAALLALGFQVRVPVEKHFGYWAVDSRTLGVVALDSPDLDCR